MRTRSRKAPLPYYQPSMGREEERAVIDTLRSGWVGKGPQTEKFEKAFKKFVGSEHAVGVNSCTAGLHLSLAAAGIKRGDEVITTPMSFPADANVIVHLGAVPRFVDVDQETMNIDPGKIAAAINKRSRALIAVDFAGHPCQMDKILSIAKKHKLVVIEDAAHALGSEYRGRKTGSIADLTAFSFYANKNITTGEGGMVTTGNAKLARKIRTLSLQGIDSDAWSRSKAGAYRHWDVVSAGYKYNMFDLQACLGLVQLKKLKKFLGIRKKYTRMYNDAFCSVPEILTPVIRKDVKHAYHLYVVKIRTEELSEDRDRIIKALQKENIGVGVHYRSLHLHPFYRKAYGFKRGDFPVAEYLSDRVISLPLYPKMREQDVRDVIAAVKKVITRSRK